MEKTFLDDRLVKNPYQDPMGNDAHQGLENFLDKFHQPGIPSNTIITDPDYYVYLWFYDSLGTLIACPYFEYWENGKILSPHDSQKLPSPNVEYPYNRDYSVNKTFHEAKQNLYLDLTPYVRQIDLPEFKPAGAEKIKTLFGETTAGSFSPYASDGQNSITLQVIDTEYSILDAIFYPWMKDINSPWWYYSNAYLNYRLTPYPNAVLEVQRPRMRWLSPILNPSENCDSRLENDSEYINYTYKYIGVKPTNYSAFEVNASGRSNLLRSLTLVSDLCIVDYGGTSIGWQKKNAENFVAGRRVTLTLGNLDNSGSTDDGTEDKKEQKEQQKKELEQAKTEQKQEQQEQKKNERDMEQQRNGDMPGEEEPDYGGRGEEEELASSPPMGNDVDDANGELGDPREEGISEETPKPWDDITGEEDFYSSELGEANKALNDHAIENPENTETTEEEKGFFDTVCDVASDVGSAISDRASTIGGWLSTGYDTVKDWTSTGYDTVKDWISDGADTVGDWISTGADVVGGFVEGTAKGTVGLATDIATAGLDLAAKGTNSATNLVNGVAGSTLGLVSKAGQSTIGATGSFLATVLGGQSDGQQSGQVVGLTGKQLGGVGTIAGAALGITTTMGNDALRGACGIFGQQTPKQSTSQQQSTNPRTQDNEKSSGVFSLFGDALKSVSSLGHTAFGTVSNLASSGVSTVGNMFGGSSSQSSKPTTPSTPSSSQSETQQQSLVSSPPESNPSPTTTTWGGQVSKYLSTGFSWLGQSVGIASDYMSGSVDKGMSQVDKLVTFPIDMASKGIDKIRENEDVAWVIEKGNEKIKDGIGFVGESVDGILGLGESGIDYTVGGLGKLMDKITTQVGDKPTPIENYVQQTTKQKTAGTTKKK